MAEDYISQFYTWATGNTITAARLNGNVSNVTDGLSGGTKTVNVGKVLIGGSEAIDSSRNATLESITLSGDITSISAAIDWDLIDNNASALSFDAVGKLGLIAIDTTDGAEGVSMSGFLTVTGTLNASGTIDLGTNTITDGTFTGNWDFGSGTIDTTGEVTAGSVVVDNVTINGNDISSTTGNLTLTPVAGSAVVIDGAASFDSGVVTGITSLTATQITGTLQTAAQGNITSVGTLTSLTVSGELTLNRDSSGLASPQLRITDAGGASESSIYNASGVLTLATHGTDNVLDNGILIGTAGQGTIIFKTANATAMTILSSQKVQFPNGLTFGSDTSDDNTLDDYEEGSWTPTITNAGSYTTQYGRYTKIGRMVFIHIKLHATGVTQDGTGVVISGLPIAADDTSDTNQRSSGFVEGDWSGFGSVADTARFRVNGSTLQGVKDSSGSSALLTHNDLGTTVEFHTTVCYYAAT